MIRHTRARNFPPIAAALLWLLPAVAWAARETGQELRYPRSTEEAMRAATMEELADEISRYWPGKEAKAVPSPADAKALPIDYRCLPTCDENDSRLFAVNASDLITYGRTSIEFTIIVPAGESSFRLAVFDGDGGGPDDRWDIGYPVEYRFTLFADPDGLGSGEVALEVRSEDMRNGEWCCADGGEAGDFVVPTGEAARTASGEYIYTLRVEPSVPCPHYPHFNALKVRTDAELSIEAEDQPLAYVSNFHSVADLQSIYPDLDFSTIPDLDPSQLVNTTYDGTFSVHFEVPAGGEELTIWDADFDHGRFDHFGLDTDDPDSEMFPPFQDFDEECPSMNAEGSNMPIPFDDLDPAGSAGLDLLLLRSPSVRYEVIFPDGRVFANDDPSGNQEWEKLTISTDPLSTRDEADHVTPTLPAGTYELRIEGLDVQNLIVLKLPYRVIPPPGGGEGCTPGYWKQPRHQGSWTLYDPDDLFTDVFGVDEGDLTLEEALRRGGGGFEALGRHAVAALLNAAAAEVDYRYGAPQILSLVQAAYAGGDPETAKDLLAAANEEGCPL